MESGEPVNRLQPKLGVNTDGEFGDSQCWRLDQDRCCWCQCWAAEQLGYHKLCLQVELCTASRLKSGVPNRIQIGTFARATRAPKLASPQVLNRAASLRYAAVMGNDRVTVVPPWEFAMTKREDGAAFSPLSAPSGIPNIGASWASRQALTSSHSAIA